MAHTDDADLDPLARRDPGLAGPSNFRDLGGYRTGDGRTVRWRTLFRSDALRFTDADVTIVRDTLGLRTAIDLRTPFEYGDQPGGGKAEQVARLAAAGVRRVHLPMVDETRIRRQATSEQPIGGRSYTKMFERGGPALAQAVGLLADPANHPLVFHCSAGKDRTGILAALILGILGVPNEVIVADYAVSQVNMAKALAKIRAHPDAERILANRPPAAFEAPTEAMVDFVATIADSYGGWEGAAANVGLDRDGVERLRDLLLTG